MNGIQWTAKNLVPSQKTPQNSALSAALRSVTMEGRMTKTDFREKEKL
jgi:hypothetical protein